MIKGDTLLIRRLGADVCVTVNFIYESGRVRVRLNDGHLIVVKPEEILRNYGRMCE